MIQLFFLSLIFILSSGLFLYRYTGKKRFLKFDLVQFIYAFSIAPLVFVWTKTFVYYLLQSEAHLLGQTNLFIIDTAVSLLGLFVYSFVIIHFITKNFEIRRYRDPLYDVFQLSEVIHLWISHLGLYFFALLVATVLSLLNVYFPLDVELSRVWFLALLPAGGLSGGVLFIAVWLSNFTKSKFMKINRLMFAFHFFAHLAMYFLLSIEFNMRFITYWFFFSCFLTTNILSIFFEKSQRLMLIIDRWHHKHPDGWSGIHKKFNNPD